MMRISVRGLLKSIIAVCIVTISAWYLWIHFSWIDLSDSLCQVRFDWLLIGGGLTYISFLGIRTLRWLVLLRGAQQPVQFTDLYLTTALFVSGSLITPGQIGELLKVEVLKQRWQLDRTTAIGLFMIERLLDLIVVLLLAIVGLLTTTPLLGYISFYWLIGVLVLSSCLAPLFLIYLRSHSAFGKRFDQLFAVIKSPLPIMIAAGLTLAAWLLVILGWQIAFAATGNWLPITTVNAVMTLTTLSILISFIPSGVGISEMVITQLLLTLGLDPPQAQAGAIIIRVIGLWWLFIGLLHLLYWWLRRSFFIDRKLK